MLIFLSALISGSFSFASDKEAAIGLSTGYSNYSGAVAAARVTFAAQLAPNWQWEAGGFATLFSKDGFKGSGIFTGPVFNLSADLTTSGFLSVGAGYSTQYPFGEGPSSSSQKPAAYSYYSAGWRFALGQSGKIVYKPALTFFYNGKRSAGEIRPLEFSFLF